MFIYVFIFFMFQPNYLLFHFTFWQIHELKSKMKSLGIPWPGDEGGERWTRAWQAIKKVSISIMCFVLVHRVYVI